MTRLTEDEGTDSFPAWSPDGKKIAFSHWNLSTNKHEIYIMNADESALTKLTSGNDMLPTQLSTDGFTSWSPDGERIAFMSFRDGNAEIYVMNADGSGQARKQIGHA